MSNTRTTQVEPILRVSDLHTHFHSERGTVRAVEGVSFEVQPGEIVGIVGESGCGKSVTSLSVMGLLPEPHGRVVAGHIVFKGIDLTTLGANDRRRLRGQQMSMVFQDPMSSLNPYLRIDEQLTEALLLHQRVSKADARKEALTMLQRVGIADAESRIRDYPHQLSGGMRQRVMLAMALVCKPELLILDEPTTALDVTVQAQILELLLELRKEHNLSAILITHDLGVVAETCDRVLVMYAGRIVEHAIADQLFRRPSHPYTRALLRSLPNTNQGQRLLTIEGLPPRLDGALFSGCTFAPRCPSARPACLDGEPELLPCLPKQDTASPTMASSQLRRCIVPLTEIAAEEDAREGQQHGI